VNAAFRNPGSSGSTTPPPWERSEDPAPASNEGPKFSHYFPVGRACRDRRRRLRDVRVQAGAFSKEFIEEIERHFRPPDQIDQSFDLGDLFDLEIYLKIIDRTLAQKMWTASFSCTRISPDRRKEVPGAFLRITELTKQYEKPVALYVSTDIEEVNWLKKNLNYPVFTQVVETVRALELNRCLSCRDPADPPTGRDPRYPADKNLARPFWKAP